LKYTLARSPSTLLNAACFTSNGAYAIPRPDYARETQEDLDRMAREGFVKPIIGKTYGFDEIPQALKDIDERRALGKLVLTP